MIFGTNVREEAFKPIMRRCDVYIESLYGVWVYIPCRVRTWRSLKDVLLPVIRTMEDEVTLNDLW